MHVVASLFAASLLMADPREMPDGQFDLRLYDALFRGEEPGDGPSPFLLVLSRKDGDWQRAWGTARGFNHDVHSARVLDAELTERTLRVELDVTLFRDARSSRDGYARFDVELERSNNGVFRGRYSGELNGTAVDGEAKATALPPYPERPETFEPIGPEEHPRILFRRSQLPALRKKAKTPLGRAALERMDGPVGLAVKYRLSGERKHAMALIPLLEKMMDRGLVSDQYGHNVGARLEKTAIAYDLCHEVWPEEFVRRVEFYMLWAGEGILDARRDTHQGVNWHISSNWASPLYSGAAFAGLALWGKEGSKPAKPEPTNAGAHIPAASDYTPGEDVPVTPLVSGVMPPEWIYAGGFSTDWVEGDPLADLGGTRDARPEVGDQVELGGESHEFRPLSHEEDEGYWAHENYDGGKVLIDVTNAVDREYFSTSYFYAALRNDKDRWVRFETSLHPATLYLNGVRLEVGEVARIEEGLYPMLVEVYIDQINPWGRQLMRPRLVEVDREEAQRLTEEREARYARDLAHWKERVEEWKRLGGMDLRYRDLFERSRHMMYLFCREAVGDGGAQAELAHYSTIAERPPSRYMAAHRKVFGYAVSPQPDIEHLLPRKMFVHVYPEGGEPRAQEINGKPEAASDLFAALFPVVPENWRPAVLWGWQRHSGFTGENWAKLVEGAPVLSLLHYPLALEPAHPGGVLPLTWRADDFGLYGFRNAWKDVDDFVFKVWLKAHHIGGWNAPNAGTFRLLGLGHVWAAGPTDRNRHRWEESVVQLPEDEGINVGAGARLTSVQTRADGSGVVSMDLSDVYAARAAGPRGRKRRLYSRYGSIRDDEAFVDSGITGMRSIGVDFSGRSGAPCIVAIVDRIRGGGSKVWTWQLEAEGSKAESDAEAEDGNASAEVEGAVVEGPRFTFAKADGTSLHGIFATGQDPVVEARMTTMTGRAGSPAGKTLERPITGIFAADEWGEFFLVATVQRGPAPEMRVEGAGLDARVVVGEQTVRFDGAEIVFGSVEASGDGE